MSQFPFDPSVPDPTLGSDSDLNSLLDTVREEVGRDIRVCMPARVVRVRGNQLVDVQPLLQVGYIAKSEPTTLRPVPNCPVLMAAGADFYFRMPVAVGDLGLLLVADRSLDTWLAGSGDPTLPNDPRTHNLTDAIFAPGLYPMAQQIPEAGNDDLVLKNGAAELRLEKSGRVRINNDGQELVDLVGQINQALADLVTTLTSAQTITMLGPQPFYAVTQQALAQATSKLGQIKSNLETLTDK